MNNKNQYSADLPLKSIDEPKNLSKIHNSCVKIDF